MSTPPGWTEADSERFLTFSDVITPSRLEQMSLLADLVPASPGEVIEIVELGCGGGELAELLLERCPDARYLGLDGSLTMRQTTARRLQRFAGRFELREFRLEEFPIWTAQLPPTRCIVASLVVHHLDDAGKQSLYQHLARVLEPGGALLLIDIVQPRSERARAALSRNWDALVREQSLALTGSLDTFHTFKQDGWNCYSHPDPMDLPAPLGEQLRWMEQAGLTDVDCFWQRGGHALFGGYKEG